MMNTVAVIMILFFESSRTRGKSILLMMMMKNNEWENSERKNEAKGKSRKLLHTNNDAKDNEWWSNMQE